MTEQALPRLAAPSTLRQWHVAKCIGTNLELVFQNIADVDGTVEQVQYNGGRDYVVFYSQRVDR